MATYSLKVDSCESSPKIVAQFEGIGEKNIMRCFQAAKEGFRDVEIINEETGEVMVRFYMSDEFHEKLFEYGETLDRIQMWAEYDL